MAWKTIENWKKYAREAADAWVAEKAAAGSVKSDPGYYPFQYGSDQERFMEMQIGDRLWVVSLPQFEGFCQPPSSIARLELEGVYPNEACPVPVFYFSDRKYVAVGKHGRVIDTYPPLYNIFDVLIDAEFEGGVKDLSKYKAWLEKADFGAKGPYYRLAQHFRTLRKLTPESGKRLNQKHRIAVDGRRIFLSYKASDFESPDKQKWLHQLVDVLEKKKILSWWDDHQMLGREEAWGKQANLIKALLDDGVQQATWFVALGTAEYGAPGRTGRRWTLEEWSSAEVEVNNPRRRSQLRRLLIDFGEGELSERLPGRADVAKKVSSCASAEEVAAMIAEVINQHN